MTDTTEPVDPAWADEVRRKYLEQFDTSKLLPARARAAVYVASAMGVAAYQVVDQDVAIPLGWRAAYGAVNIGVLLLAGANTPKGTAK